MATNSSLTKVNVVLRPAPANPVIPPGTSPAMSNYLSAIQNWCREAERAVRELNTALNQTRSQVAEISEDSSTGGTPLTPPVVNTVWSGSGVPGSGLGSNGDFYIDTAEDMLYGPKASGVWPAGVSLVGPQGDPGADGATGPEPILTWVGDQIAVDGVVAADAPHLTGPAGVDGIAGPAGPAGADGADGADGHSPVVTWSGDQVVIDGTPGPHLTGPAGADGHSPVLTWSGDQIAIDGVVSGPHLTGPAGSSGSGGVDILAVQVFS